MQILHVIELKGLENTTAALTKGMIQPYVRENYINKFKGRLANDLFGSFINSKSHNTGIQLTGNNSECLVIETDMFDEETELLEAIAKANQHEKTCTLFSTFYALDIDIISICLLQKMSTANVFLLRSKKDIQDMYNQGFDKQFILKVIK